MDKSNDPCDYPDHSITIGPRIILEDSYPERFSTIGGFVNYTYVLNQHWGLSADVGYTAGSQFDQDYTKLNIMAGPTWYPCTKHNLDDPFSFYAHLLGGYSTITSKYSSGTMTQKSSDGSFSAMFGLNGQYNFNSKFGIRVSANYNMNFTEGNTSNNYLFDAGLGLKF
jgi:hypothetical protein